ncbi:septal ring lytic transglycosylase RlpA family protein [Oscillatoria sp. FACHB-1407]|uniref:septal ring lytic transglycosylase RlpA family protein n=1 Tax=Oscillatoria sp. FACHB-1407 TaxID=2692847 RepID=UPI00168671E9|nr:septal ring lytic transglycosylase RlpA family protein [Oscillatoria sp. FACHB-1407]MBD2465628.1 septal ring lytic transglycosylase RlpA family protein [Oscillatoria sp. FACHB-1407]
MNFIGLIWLASYVSSFFSSHNILKTSESIVRFFSSKVQPVQASTNSPTAVASGVAPDLSLASTLSSLPLNRSSRTQIPLIQSFLQPFSWLPFSEGATLRLDWTRPFTSHTGNTTRFTPMLGVFPFTNSSGEASGQMTRLVANLSRWSHKVGQAMPLVPAVVVTTRPSGKPLETLDSSIQQCLPAHAKGFSPAETFFQVRVQGQVVAELPSQTQANAIAQRLKRVLRQPEFEPTSLKPAIANDAFLGKAGSEVLFTIDSDLERSLHRNGDLIAIDWINNLRTALDAPTLSLTEAQTHIYGLVQTGQTLSGTASWYGPYFHGRLTAAGETFNQHEFTAAHPSLPFDTYLKVTNLRNGNTVIVRVNDRGPYVGERSLDLSRLAARCLGSEQAGVVPYEAVVLEPGIPSDEPKDAQPSTGAIARQP